MKCPVCTDSDLVMSERQGIEVDYCPRCRGVWLDRGELDKIIERAAREERDADDDDRRRSPTDAREHGVAPPAGYGAPPPPGYGAPPYGAPPPPPQYGYGHGHYGYHKKRKSFWSELFDD
jgi:Zn-finger nucleic acid-binding protein